MNKYIVAAETGRPGFIPIMKAYPRILSGQLNHLLLICSVQRFRGNAVDMEGARGAVTRDGKCLDNEVNVFYRLNGATCHQPAFAAARTNWPLKRRHMNVGRFNRLAEMAAGSR